jgi:hypothetical protein
MTTKSRVIAPALLLLVVAIAACTPATSSGAPATAGTSVATSGAPSGSAAPSGSGAAGSPAASASAGASGAAGGGDLASQIPETVGDVTLSATITNADAYIKANVNRQLTPLLTALGKTPADVTVATATGSAAGGANLFIDAVQITGTDAEALLTGFQTAATAVPGSQVEAVDVGGKSAVKITTTSYTLAAYATGDILFYVQSTDPALVDAALAALP